MNSGSNAFTAKQARRAWQRAERGNITAEERRADSRAALQLLRQQIVWREARKIMVYAPRLDELDISPLVADALVAGKVVALPRFDRGTRTYQAARVTDVERDLQPGQFGIPEPSDRCVAVPLNQLDLILVPGIVFALDGSRLGRGRGFYDRMLVEARGIKCGVAFDYQIVAEIPMERHDVLMDYLLTPTRWLCFQRHGEQK